jgi:polyisoprenyl-teichoic acid--peptidoglycan teichoic acid transferase
MIIAASLVIIMGVAIGGFYYIDSKIYVSTKKGSKHSVGNSISAFQSIINSVTNQSGVDNIVLAGVDSRSKETASRTDSIMLATVDRSNKEVKLTSFMRDMFVPIPGYSKNYKINTAYFFGGPDLLIDTLNQNFNTNAQYYVTIDFSAFQALVDKFNGIDLNVKPNEVNEMNKYIKEANWSNPEYVETAGMQHLNGQQVLSYCRIRHVGNNDYERTERQRRVLTLLIQKVRKESIFSLPSLMSAILPYIKTNIPSSKLLAFGISAYKFSKTPVTTLRVPADGMYSSQSIGGQDVLVPDFQKNSDMLNQFIASSGLMKSEAGVSGIKNTSNENTNAALSNDKTTTTDISGSNLGVPAPSSPVQSDIDDTSNIAQKSSISVCILNSTGKAGLAAEYKNKLETLGYNVIKTDNYPYKKYSSTIINDYSKGGFGDMLLGDLKIGNVIKKHKARPIASVVVILGSDSAN